MAFDPERTSKPNGWIYGGFEPVEILPNSLNKDAFPLMLAMKPGSDLLNFFESTDNLLNALDLKSHSKKAKLNVFLKYLQNEKFSFPNFNDILPNSIEICK